MQWVEGSPLQNWIGLPKLYAEELGETQVEVVGTVDYKLLSRS